VSMNHLKALPNEPNTMQKDFSQYKRG